MILERAVEAYLRVKNDLQRYAPTGPGSKWKNAALEVAAEIPRNNSAIPLRPKKKQSLEQVRSQAQGSVLRWLKMLLERGADNEAVALAFEHFYAATLSRLLVEHQEADSS